MHPFERMEGRLLYLLRFLCYIYFSAKVKNISLECALERITVLSYQLLMIKSLLSNMPPAHCKILLQGLNL